MTPEEKNLIADFVRRFELALTAMPVQQRNEIVAELNSHLSERAEQGDKSLRLALSKLGDPYEYARPFLEDFELGAALNRASPIALLASILGRATGSLVALALGTGAVIFYSLALSFALIAVLKPVTPNHVGYWNSAATFQFGFISAPPAGPELLGIWIVPISIVAAVFFYLGGTAMMKRGGRLLLRRDGSRAAR